MRTTADAIAQLATVSAWRAFTSGFAAEPPPANIRDLLPDDYLEFLRVMGAGEGFIGKNFLRLYAIDELVAVNLAYRVLEYMPGHVLIGSDGAGNAYLLDVGKRPSAVIASAFVPLDGEYSSVVAADFLSFVVALAQVPSDFDRPLPLPLNPNTVGLELHEKHPIVLGGDPLDRENRVFLTPPVHAQACTYFNRLFRDVRGQSQGF